MEIHTLGEGRRLRVCQAILADMTAGCDGRLLLLPIPTSRDNTYITSTSLLTRDLANLAQGCVLVAGYNVPRGVIPEGIKVYDAALDEEFLLANAILTARGALGYILTHWQRDISDMKIGIIGYGRIGREMLRLLLLFGVDATLYTRRKSVAIELCEAGISAELIEAGDCPTGLDILINTTPEGLIDESRLNGKTDIIDLASGSIFEPSERLIKMSSIPDKMYPESAGELYAEGILKQLREEGIIL